MDDKMNGRHTRNKGNPAPMFPEGQLVQTPGVAERIPISDVYRALYRHACGGWGQGWPSGWKEKEKALQEGARLLSAFTSSTGLKFWVITEADRSVTTVLLPDEY